MGLDLQLWNEFDYFELTKNMRQISDPKYADILYRVRYGIIIKF
jgi:hypothetical protein